MCSSQVHCRFPLYCHSVWRNLNSYFTLSETPEWLCCPQTHLHRNGWLMNGCHFNFVVNCPFKIQRTHGVCAFFSSLFPLRFINSPRLPLTWNQSVCWVTASTKERERKPEIRSNWLVGNSRSHPYSIFILSQSSQTCYLMSVSCDISVFFKQMNVYRSVSFPFTAWQQLFSVCVLSASTSVCFSSLFFPLKLEAIMCLMWLITCSVTPWHLKKKILFFFSLKTKTK